MPTDDATSANPSEISNDFDARVTSIAALAEPVRRALYGFVVAQSEPVSREYAAEGVGVARHVAKFHLEKLVEDGLLEFEYRRPPERRGPGAGRPAKVYRRSPHEVAVSLPERRYELVGRLLAEAVTRSEHDGESVASALRNAAQATGRSLGEKIRMRAGLDTDAAELRRAAIAELEDQGYEPRLEAGDVVMFNCPFHSLASEYTELVCGINLEIMHGVLDRLGTSGLEAKLDPTAGRCCVRLHDR